MGRGMIRLGRLAALGAVVMVGSGCATVVTGGGGNQKVTITSNPPGAAVTVDGKPYGCTPAALALDRRDEHQVQLTAAGYETANVTLRSRLNPWVFGNLVLGGPLGLIIDVISDATYRLTPSELEVDLRGIAAPVPPLSTSVPSVGPSASSPPAIPGV